MEQINYFPYIEELGKGEKGKYGIISSELLNRNSLLLSMKMENNTLCQID